jgi:hypothetical protein
LTISHRGCAAPASAWEHCPDPEERQPYVQWNMRQVLDGWKERSAREYRPLDYLPRCRSRPRCLECSGTEFVRFEEWNRWYEHPEGSGKF